MMMRVMIMMMIMMMTADSGEEQTSASFSQWTDSCTEQTWSTCLSVVLKSGLLRQFALCFVLSYEIGLLFNLLYVGILFQNSSSQHCSRFLKIFLSNDVKCYSTLVTKSNNTGKSRQSKEWHNQLSLVYVHTSLPSVNFFRTPAWIICPGAFLDQQEAAMTNRVHHINCQLRCSALLLRRMCRPVTTRCSHQNSGVLI